MSYNMNGGQNHMMPPGGFTAYQEPNMFAQAQYQQNGQSPQIYTVSWPLDGHAGHTLTS